MPKIPDRPSFIDCGGQLKEGSLLVWGRLDDGSEYRAGMLETWPGPKIKCSYLFLFYFVRQLYSVIDDMNCGCDVMSATSVQLTPKTLAFPAIVILQVCAFFILQSVGLHARIILLARGTIWTQKLKLKTTHTKRSGYNSQLPVHCKANCRSFPASILKAFL